MWVCVYLHVVVYICVWGVSVYGGISACGECVSACGGVYLYVGCVGELVSHSTCVEDIAFFFFKATNIQKKHTTVSLFLIKGS